MGGWVKLVDICYCVAWLGPDYKPNTPHITPSFAIRLHKAPTTNAGFMPAHPEEGPLSATGHVRSLPQHGATCTSTN